MTENDTIMVSIKTKIIRCLKLCPEKHWKKDDKEFDRKWLQDYLKKIKEGHELTDKMKKAVNTTYHTYKINDHFDDDDESSEESSEEEQEAKTENDLMYKYQATMGRIMWQLMQFGREIK
ncbi:MAG: hypothetical protein GY861_10690 [bacterium]|nr:hypothetical protein [bacterium]